VKANWLLCSLFLSLATTTLSAQAGSSAKDLRVKSSIYTLGVNPSKPEIRNVFEIDASTNFLGRAKFRSRDLGRDRIRYFENREQISYTHFIDCDTGFNIGLSYMDTGIFWRENPDFHQECFQNACVSLGLYSTYCPDWLWRANITARFNVDSTPWTRSVMYAPTFWGRYSLSKRIGLHVGFTAETDLRRDKFWPIFGVDWQVTKSFKLNLVFPVDISAVYALTPHWSLAAAVRWFRYRTRIGRHDVLHGGFSEYQNTGTEIRLCYEYSPFIQINAHGGEAWGGFLRISNHKDRHAVYYKFKSSPYVGGDLVIRF
jgi:hypothetical protein